MAPLVRTAGAVALAAALLTGCLGEGSCTEATSAGCADAVVYDGHVYLAWSDRLPVERGEPLGDAEYPVCNDTGECGEDVGEPRPTRVWAMRGADPEQVVVARSEGGRRLVVFGRLDADPDDYFELVRGAWQVRGSDDRTTQEVAPSR